MPKLDYSIHFQKIRALTLPDADITRLSCEIFEFANMERERRDHLHGRLLAQAREMQDTKEQWEAARNEVLKCESQVSALSNELLFSAAKIRTSVASLKALESTLNRQKQCKNDLLAGKYFYKWYAVTLDRRKIQTQNELDVATQRIRELSPPKQDASVQTDTFPVHFAVAKVFVRWELTYELAALLTEFSESPIPLQYRPLSWVIHKGYAKLKGNSTRSENDAVKQPVPSSMYPCDTTTRTSAIGVTVTDTPVPVVTPTL